MTSSKPRADACLTALANAFDAASLLVGGDVPERNKTDMSFQVAVAPLAVVRPTAPEGVATALKICAEHKMAVVPQGGLTGLAGGAHPLEDAVALSLERLQGIEEIDTASATMTVLAGTQLETVQRAAQDVGFFIPLDLGARGSCSVGGNLATNAGGNRVIRYGMAREMVLGLEVALADGTLMTSLNKMIKNNAGYDLKQLFIGSEGTLGIITRAVLRLQPEPGTTTVALCGLNDYAGVSRLLDAARRGLGPQLSAFEVMWPDYWSLVTQRIPSVRSPLESCHEFYVLVEAQGLGQTPDNSHFQQWLEDQFTGGLVADAAISQSNADARDFWRVRDAAGEFLTVLGPHCAFDIGLPVARMDAFAVACRKRLHDELTDIFSVYYGHIGDGNMHIVALREGARVQPTREINHIVYETVRSFGGTISAEHGIGTLKKPYLSYTRTAEELALMQRLKQAFDPLGILNPGRVLDRIESAQT